MLYKIVLMVVLTVLTRCIEDISHYGAVPNSDTIVDQFKNQKAFMLAFAAANQSLVDRAVRIPAKTYYSFPLRI